MSLDFFAIKYSLKRKRNQNFDRIVLFFMDDDKKDFYLGFELHCSLNHGIAADEILNQLLYRINMREYMLKRDDMLATD